MSDSPGEELSNVAITRHAVFWLNGVIPVEQQSKVSDEIQDFFYPHFKIIFMQTPRIERILGLQLRSIYIKRIQLASVMKVPRMLMNTAQRQT